MSERAYRSERHRALSCTYPSESCRAAFYTPAPARRINRLRRIARALLKALT